MNITCDNHLWFYADDQTVIEPTTAGAADWTDTNHVSVPSDTKVYGIKCDDVVLVGGIIASFSDDTTTDANWRLVNIYIYIYIYIYGLYYTNVLHSICLYTLKM